LRAKNDFIDLHFPDLLSTILLKWQTTLVKEKLKVYSSSIS
jgi:hypothetical protein